MSGETRAIEVLRPGLQTTVQDLGRPGWRAAGVPAGGAMDPWAARAANRLVGNGDGAALLEIVLAGPLLRFAAVATVAWIGGGVEARSDGRALAAGVAWRLAAGSRLDLGRTAAGARAWLAVGGGLEVPAVLGSRATDLAAGFGGLCGRALRAGDLLRFGVATPFRERRLAAAGPGAPAPLRILVGPDGSRPVAALGALAGSWRVSARSDRRGVRLESATPAPGATAELRSQGVLPGAVQWLPSGGLIVLGVDAPVTGGYPWIAQVIEADVGRLAHLPPGAAVGFEPCDPERAAAALARRERELAAAVRE